MFSTEKSGLCMIAIGRLLGAKTIWLDSIANSAQLSKAGRVASLIAHVCLTQWPQVAAPLGLVLQEVFCDFLFSWGAIAV